MSNTITTSGTPGSGADGLTLTILDAAAGGPSALGSIGGGLGWPGIPGFAVAFDTFQDPGDPSYNSVGLVTGWNPAKARPRRIAWSVRVLPQRLRCYATISVTSPCAPTRACSP